MKENYKQIHEATALTNVVGQVGCLVVLIIGLALGGGMLLDNLLSTDSIITVLLMVGSVPISLFVAMRLSLRAIARAQQQFSEANEMEEKSEA